MQVTMHRSRDGRTHETDEDTKRVLVMLMNRYDMRPTVAGALLAEIDKMALALKGQEQ